MQEVFQEKDLFRGYEVRNWDFSPMIYKILAASALINIVGLAIFSQTNLLTKKGCDSPFVSTVCEVLDTIYVGNKLFGTDGDYVVKEYNKTDIGEDDEVTFINVDNISPPIAYPPGYFALANPEQYSVDANGLMVKNNGFENLTPGFPGIPESSQPLTTSTPNLPPVNNNPLKGKVDDSPWAIVNTPNPTDVGKKPRNGKNPTIKNDPPTELPKLGGETADVEKDPKLDEKTAKDSDPVKDVEINKKPFQDLGKFVGAKWAVKADQKENSINLKPFKVVLNAKLAKKIVKDQDGKEREVVAFDAKKSKWAQLSKEEAGDQEMVEIAKQAIGAVGDSNFLSNLYNLGMKDLNITLIQKDDKIYVGVESVQISEERAKTLASGLNGLMAAGKLAVKAESDEKFLLDRAQPPTTNGKTIVLKFEIEKNAAQEMILRKLVDEAKKDAEKAKQNPNNSTATTFNSNTNSGR
jgi:hypothetical protein